MQDSDQERAARVQTVRSGFERWAAHDIDGVVTLFHEDCEISALIGQLEGQAFRGHEGVRQWFADVYADWSEFCPEFVASAELEDALLVAGRLHARGRGSGIELNVPCYWRFAFGDGRIAFMASSGEPSAAHRAAGLADA